MRVEKFLIVVNNITFYATYDSAEADEKAAFWREKMTNSEVVIQIETVSEKQAIAELLDRVKAEKQCVEVLKTQIQEMTNVHNLEIGKKQKELNARDGFLIAQGKILVEAQKKIQELQNVLKAPQNRAQRDLFQEREKTRKLERKLSEVRR